jgi:hypothetical protein
MELERRGREIEGGMEGAGDGEGEGERERGSGRGNEGE